MTAGFCITVRNENDEIIEYHTSSSVLHIDIPEGRYVITVTSEAGGVGEQNAAFIGWLQ